MHSLRALSLLVVVGCNTGWDTIEFVDEGDVCVDVEDGGGLSITVQAPDCLSSSCTRNVEAMCTATRDGATIRVESEISWEENHRRFAACTEDCGLAEATCSLAALPDGDYTIAIGDDERPLTLPLADPGCPL